MLRNVKKMCAIGVQNNRLMSGLSLCTMCLLITSSIIIITIISITPVIILGIGEIENGQRDMILYPQLFTHLNSTKIEELSGEKVMPRIDCRMSLNDHLANGWFMDFNLERAQHLGVIGGNQQPNHTQVYAHTSLGVPQGHKVNITLESHTLFKIIENNLQLQDNTHQAAIKRELEALFEGKYTVTGEFEVKETFDTAMGKFGAGSTTNFLYLDINYSLQQMLQQTYRTQGLNASNSALLPYVLSSHFRLQDFSSEATINIPNRIEVYSNTDYQSTEQTLSQFGEQILEKIGLFSVQSFMPIASNLTVLGYLGMFVGVVLKLIVVSLFSLSAIMMNNMLLMGIERKSFDFALIKTMGASRALVVVNILTDSLTFVSIANVISYPLSYFILDMVSALFVEFFGYSYVVRPTMGAIAGGIVIGVLVPIISSVSPIWSILNNDLIEHLNPIRNKTEAIHTEIYVEGKQFPTGKLAFGIIATTFGISIYYLLPKSLINQDISLLLLIFFGILEGLLLGLILLSYSFQYLFEKLIAYLFFFWANSTDFALTIKNLSAHRFKNRRSSLLYALSVSFIVFTSVGISLQIQTIYNSALKRHGSYVEVWSYDQIQTQLYEQILPTIPGVVDWAYVTADLKKYLQKSQKVVNVQLSDKAKLFYSNTKIIGVSPNYLNCLYYNNTSVYKTRAPEPYTPYEYLSTKEGFMTATIGQYLAKKFNILEDDDNNEFFVNIYWGDRVKRVPLNYSTIYQKRAGLRYSEYSFGRNEVGVSFDTYMALSNIPHPEKLPIKSIKIGIEDPQKAREIAAQIQSKTMRHNTDTVWDYSELKQTISRIESLLENILNILLVIVLTISFFSLVATSYINIIGQTTEIAILMTLGYSKLRITKIYAYENFILVVSSCLIGILVGFIVAWMMSLQRELFEDFPVYIQINGIWIIAFAAVASSLISTIYPLRQIFSRPISSILNYT